MLGVILGGSGSGKSAYAEERALQLAGRKYYYLATMKVYEEEGRQKVVRHRKLRAGKGFVTVEQPIKIGRAAAGMEPDAVVLLECMSNLAANEMFRETEIREVSVVVSEVLYGIRVLKEQVKDLLIVTNNVFEDGVCYDTSTMCYMEALGRINEALAAEAEEVTEVIAGIPVRLK